jgi:hypothetical protein
VDNWPVSLTDLASDCDEGSRSKVKVNDAKQRLGETKTTKVIVQQKTTAR